MSPQKRYQHLVVSFCSSPRWFYYISVLKWLPMRWCYFWPSCGWWHMLLLTIFALANFQRRLVVVISVSEIHITSWVSSSYFKMRRYEHHDPRINSLILYHILSFETNRFYLRHGEFMGFLLWFLIMKSYFSIYT